MSSTEKGLTSLEGSASSYPNCIEGLGVFKHCPKHRVFLTCVLPVHICFICIDMGDSFKKMDGSLQIMINIEYDDWGTLSCEETTIQLAWTNYCASNNA